MEMLTEDPSVEAPTASTTLRRRKWAVAVGALAIVGIAATAVALTRGDDAPRQGRIARLAAPQPDLHYVMDAAPASWVASNAGESVPSEFAMGWMLWGNYQASMYGTTDDPSAPVMILGVGEQLNDGGFAGVGFPLDDQTQWTSDRTAGMCGTDGTGVRRCFVTVDGTEVQSHSSGLTPDSLQSVLTTLRVRDGVPEVDLAALPSGMAHLGSWRDQMPSAVGENGDAVISNIRYEGPENAIAFLWVGRDGEHDLAAAFDLGATEPITVDGVTFFHGTSESGLIEFVVWQRDGRAFQLMATSDKGVDPIDLARSVRPATDGEWAAAVAAERPSFQRSTASTTAALEPVAPQLAPQPKAVHDVPVTVTAVERVGQGGIAIGSTLPDGSGVPITLLRDGSTTSVGIDNEFITYSGGDDTSAIVSTIHSTTSWGAFVVTTDTRAAFLRLTRANGERYVAALVPDPAREGLRVAAITVPIDEFVGADLVDEFGTRLDAFGFPAD